MEENNTTIENRKWLYDKLTSKNINLGSFEQFNDNINDNQTREWVYNKATESGLNLGTYDDFNNNIINVKPASQTTGATFPALSASPVEEVKQDYTPKYAPRTKDVKETDMLHKQESEYATGFGQGFKQGVKGLGQGMQHLSGEVLNLFTGSTIDEEKALERIAELERDGIDIESAIAPLDKAQKMFYETATNQSGEIKLQGLTDEDVAYAQKALEKDAVNKTIRKYIEKAGGLEEAKTMLAERASEETAGDKLIKRATQGLAELKPTKGFGAWVGNLAPQMIPTAVSMGVGAITKNSTLAKGVGWAGMTAMTASTAGMSMNEAREAGATGLQTWAVGIADGAIEFVSEKIPFNRYTSRLLSGVKKNTGSKLADAVTNSPQARNELERLLQEANKKLGGKLFNGKNVKDFVGDIIAEGVSEFTAEALQTITPMIYENPEDYPTIGDILRNGWEGAKAGVFMGSVIGGASKTMEHYRHRNRRKEQGFVDVVEFETKDGSAIGELVGMKDDKFIVLFDGKDHEIAPENIMFGHRFSFEEFDRAELRMENEESFDNGYSLSEQQEMNDAKNMYEYQRTLVEELVDDNMLQMIDNDPVSAIEFVNSNDSWTYEERDRIIDYINAKATYDGMIQRVRDDIDRKIEQSNALIDSHTNKHTGKIHGAVSKEDGRLVYIVSGNVAPYSDGTGIDLQNSDESIIIRDAESGELKMVSPEFLSSVYDVQDPNEQKEINAQQIREKIVTEESDKIDGVVVLNQGDTYTITDDKGNPLQVQITANEQGLIENPDGTVNVSDGKKTFAIPKDVIQQQVDAANMQRAVDFSEKEKEIRSAIQQATATPENVSYGMGDNVSLRDADGSIINGTISMVEDDFYIIDYNDSNGTWQPLNLTQQELDDMIVEHNGVMLKQPVTEQKPVEEINNNINNTSSTEGNDNGVQEWYTNIHLSGELDQNNVPFVLSPDGNVDFGYIESMHNLPEAPIRLSMGDISNGYIHINKRHGNEIKKAGFNSIEEFIKYVADNFTRIQEGSAYDNSNNDKNQSYLIQLQDGHNNTLFVQLSRDSKYWNVNSAGIFGKSYGNKKKNIWSASEVQNDNSAVVSDGSQSEPIAENGSTSNGTPSKSSEYKDNNSFDANNNTQKKVSATSLIPKDESGNPIYEQSDPETAWDALMELTKGNEARANILAQSTIEEKEAELKKLADKKIKFKAGMSVVEKNDALEEHENNIEKIKQNIEAWKKIASVPMQRQIAEQERQRQLEAEAVAQRKAEEERLMAERQESERIERERINGIPDIVDDTPHNARLRGYRRVNGHLTERQQPLQAVQGKETDIEFSNDIRPKGHYAVIDAAQLQPSHIQGNRNPLHFLDEAQPKERNDEASIVSAQKIAGNIRPATITKGETAYVGTPTVNTRGEVIQGNSRSDALKLMYGNHKDQAQAYRQYLVDNADQFGLNPEDVSNMESPVLVRMLDVDDEQAITLGQYVAQDTESGGVERIKPKNTVKKMGNDIGTYANMLLSSHDEDMSFAELLDQNGVEVLKWMAQKGYITPTQYDSQFDTKGNLTAEAKNDLRGIMYQSIFEGGSTRLEEMFNSLPAKAQKAILATAHRDFNSPVTERMMEEIQNSIRAFYALMQDEQFAKAKNFKDALLAVDAWQRQYQMDDVTGESYLPAEKFTNFALRLATMYKGEKQSNIQGVFTELYDLIQGVKEDNLFEQADNTPRTLVQAIKETLNIDYNGQRRNNVLAGDNKTSQQGQHGRTGDVASGKRTEDEEQSTDSSGRAAGDSGKRENSDLRSDRLWGTDGRRTEEVTDGHLSDIEADAVISLMKLTAEVANEVELNPDSWESEFGENGMMATPIGMVKMGENQYLKLLKRNRAEYFGMIRPTLTNPDIVLEEYDPKEGAERQTKYLFVKTFVKADGSRYVHFESVTVQKDTLEVSISSHEVNEGTLIKKMQQSKLLHLNDKFLNSDGRLIEPHNEGSDLVPSPNIISSPVDKDTTISHTNNGVDKKVSDNKENKSDNSLSEQIESAEAEVNTTPTDKQKEVRGNKPEWLDKVPDDGRNFFVYVKLANEKKYAPINLTSGLTVDRLVYATMVQKEKLLSLVEKLPSVLYEDAEFQIRDAKGKVYYSSGVINETTISQESEQVSDQDNAPYSIAPAQYTTKEGNSVEESSAIDKELEEDVNLMSVLSNRDLKKVINDLKELISFLEEARNYPENKDKIDKINHDITRRRKNLEIANDMLKEHDNGDWKHKFGVRLSYNKDLSIEDVKTLFENLNTDEDVAKLFERVFAVAKTLGLRIKVTDQLSKARGNAGTDGVVKYAASTFYTSMSDQEKAGVLLHELIHTVTMHAISLHQNRARKGVVGKELYDKLPEEIKQACRELEDIYYTIVKDDAFKGQYGITSMSEMIAELSNVNFRSLLKEKNLWVRIINSIKRFFGFEIKDSKKANNALVEAEKILVDMLDNFDRYTYDAIHNKLDELGQIRKRIVSSSAQYQKGDHIMESESEAFRRATDKTMKQLESIGIAVEMVSDEQTEAMLGDDGIKFMSERGMSMLKKAANTINRWLSDNTQGKSFELHLPEHTRKLIKKAMGRDFDSHNITSNGIAHALKNHGENGTKLNDRSIPIRKEDAELIPYIMTAPDRVEKATTDISGRESVRFYKELSNGYVVVVEKEYKNSPDDMETITMWAEKSSKATNAQQDAAPDTHVQNAILSTDVAKIQKDAENAILNDEKINFSRSAGIFYSNAKKAVLDIKQDKATAQQWIAMLKKNGGLKAGEDAWVGLEAWLSKQSGSVSKQEIVDYIDENSIQIEEVEYGEAPDSFDKLKKEYERLLREEGYDYAQEVMLNRYGDDFDIAFDDVGGELVIDNEDAAATLLGNDNINIINRTRLEYTTEGLKNKHEIALVVPTIEPYNSHDEIHFGDAGDGRAVAWVRFGETKDKGGKRVLVIDEIQSKRHQDGREKGYGIDKRREDFLKARQEQIVSGLKELGVTTEVFENDDYRFVDDTDGKPFGTFPKRIPADERGELIGQYAHVAGKLWELKRHPIPSAPFEKNWHELAMKRMLRYAAENGFDKVAWTTGEQQSERYNIGGEGMKGFYDNMLPAFVNKYGKKWGAKVGEVSLPKIGDNGLKMHSVDVTPQMKEDVLKGQPMFHKVYHGSGAEFERFDHNFMGTGEGAQAYGWGTYVTEVKGIGKAYATEVVDKDIRLRIDAKKDYIKHRKRNLKECEDYDKYSKRVLRNRKADEREYKAALKAGDEKDAEFYRELIKWCDEQLDPKNHAELIKSFKEDIDKAENEINSLLDSVKGKHNLYTVEIPDDNGNNYLHWEKVNKRIVNKVAKSLPEDKKPSFWTPEYLKDNDTAKILWWMNENYPYRPMSGEAFYNVISACLGSDKAASEFLNRAGFAGISYPAQASTGGRDDGARNFVIFNENDAKITNRISFMRTSNGKIYGWSVGGKIYLTKDGINPNTPVHEYTHLWAESLMKSNPVLWGRIVNGLKDTPAWNEVMLDKEYSSIHHNDNLVASEVLSRLSGTENYRRTMEEAQREIDEAKGIFEKAEKITVLERIKQAFKDFWSWVAKTFGTRNVTPEEAVNMTLNDFWNGVKPESARSEEAMFMFIGEKGAKNNDNAEEASTRLGNLAIARRMETDFNTIKQNIEKLKRSKAIAVDFNDEYELNRDSAKQWLKDNLRGEYTNADTGDVITISKVGINEVTSHGSNDIAHLISLKAVPDFIKESVFIKEIANTKDNDKYDSYRYYVCGAKINDEDYTVKVVIGVKGDNKYYDLRLTQIEKGKLIDNLNGLSNSVAENQNADSSAGKDTKLISILRINEEENARKIKLATGWERGADGKWRYETDDVKVKKDISDIRYGLYNGEEYSLSDILSKKSYAEFISRYPEFANVKISSSHIGEYSAHWDSKNNTIVLNESSMESIEADELNRIIVHELQHAIQYIEGFAQGSSPSYFRNDDFETYTPLMIRDLRSVRMTADELLKKGEYRYLGNAVRKSVDIHIQNEWLSKDTMDLLNEYDDAKRDYIIDAVNHTVEDIERYREYENDALHKYMRTAGEVESRNVERRMNMTHKERKASLASETEDVAREDQIFLYNAFRNASDVAGTEEDDDVLYKEEEEDENLRFLYGGNSGYVGYSMSKRAMSARNEGRYPKTDFRKEYEVSVKSFDILVDAGIIQSGEWHHTSKFGNKTPFYGWEEDFYADIYQENKADIDKMARMGDISSITSLFKEHPLTRKNDYDNETDLAVRKIYNETDKEISAIQNEWNSKVSKYKKAVVSALGNLSNVVVLNYGNIWFNASNGVSIKLDSQGVELACNYSEESKNKGISKAILRKEAQDELNKSMELAVKENNIEIPDNDYYSNNIERLKKEQSEKIERFIQSREDEYDKNESDTLFSHPLYTTKQKKNYVEKISGGLWIEDKQEFAKFVSAVENYVFEEDGEGITYTDNHFYAYYWNINGEPIPYIDVYLNAEESQDVIRKIQRLNEKRRVHIGIGEYIDRAIDRAENTYGDSNGSISNNESGEGSSRNDKLGRNIQRKGRYAYNPSLYVKTSRADRYTRDGINTFSSPTRAQRRQMIEHVENLAKRLHLDNIETVNSVSGLDEEKKSAKGFYNPKTGKITIVIPNNTSVADIEKTLLHEAVAHHGLRELFGKDFDTFLDNVYNNVEENIRKRIAKLAIRKYDYDFRKATEEYLASLAENTDFENAQQSGWWQKIKDFFADMLGKLGFKDFRGVTLTDNELRYILWRSYENLSSKRHKGVFGQAADIAKQYELGTGEFENDIEVVNREFNKELDKYINGGTRANSIFHIGRPNGVMQMFLPNLPIVMRPRILNKSSNTKHNVDIASLKNLPSMISNPIFVFKRNDNTIGVLTEIKDRDGKNVCVAIELNRTIQDGSTFLEVNDIRSIHGRETSNLILPIVNNNTLVYVDKEKGLDWLSSASYDYQQEIDSKDLYSATKVIQNFENPTVDDDILFRDGDSHLSYEKKLARESFDKLIKTGWYQSREALQDSMLSLKEFMEIVTDRKKHIEDIAGHENAYIGENRLSSVNQAEAEIFIRTLFKPMLKAISVLARNEAEREELINYMFAKHGLERNEYMRIKEAIMKELDKIDKANEAYNKQLKDFDNDNLKGEISLGEPGAVLEACGIKASDIFITPKTLSKHLKKHNLSATDIRNLPKALEDPIMVYEWGTKAKSMIIVTQIKKGKQRITVAIKLERGGERLEVNEIASVHGKDAGYFIEEMSNAKEGGLEKSLRYVNKGKALDWLGLVPPEGTASLNDQELSIANVIQNFENPVTRIQKIQNGSIKLKHNKDYAGLTALTGFDNVQEAEAEAQKMVKEYESNHKTADLWNKVNAVSKAILQKQFDCGMMSKDTFDKISSMYKFYIPLRGFDEKTSAEAYAYLTHKESAFNAPIKQAYGRSSKADDPFAQLQAMAESSIMQGNRNRLVKQRFLNFVLKHPSDLVSVSELWLEYDEANDEWKPKLPENIKADDSGEVVEQKMKEHEEKMKALAEKNPDRYRKASDDINIPYRVVTSRELHEHQVIVKRNGKDVVLTVNGNPRLAQALNGLTNPDGDSGMFDKFLKAGELVNRYLSAAYTTHNPDFMVSNFFRDMLYTNVMSWLKESPNYALRFHKNYAKCNPVTLIVLYEKYHNGTLDMNKPVEKMFGEFIRNGGETGFTNLEDIDKRKKKIARELRKMKGNVNLERAFSLLGEKYDEVSRSIENCARFAAYMTSREFERSIDRSIYDAKEISVNFNKKGSGATFLDSNGLVGKMAAGTSGLGRAMYVFWNAAIQGTTNFGRQVKRHPYKTMFGMAVMFLLGALMADLGDDDEDNAYYNQPEWVRRSNITFSVGGEDVITIPLSVEFRAIYGMGELASSVIRRREYLNDAEIAKAIACQVSQILPLDFMQGGNAFIPSAIKPVIEAFNNEDWTGRPIYKEMTWNKNAPEWTKAFDDTNRHIVNMTKALSDRSGGDDFVKGGKNLNPARIEHILEGYFGGYYKTADKLVRSVQTAFGAREYDPSNILLVNRLHKKNNERTQYGAVHNEYKRLEEEYELTRYKLKRYEKAADNGIFEYAEKIDFLNNSPEYTRYLIFDEHKEDIDDKIKELKGCDDAYERKILERELNELKKEMIEEINKTRKRA